MWRVIANLVGARCGPAPRRPPSPVGHSTYAGFWGRQYDTEDVLRYEKMLRRFKVGWERQRRKREQREKREQEILQREQEILQREWES